MGRKCIAAGRSNYDLPRDASATLEAYAQAIMSGQHAIW